MNTGRRIEEWLAALLCYGSWLASGTIGLGFTLALIASNLRMQNLAILPSVQIAKTGIVLLILLPILRVSLMVLIYIRERDFRLSLIAALVLAIILLGIVLGLPATSAVTGCLPDVSVSRAVSTITSTTRPGTVYIGL